MSDVADAVTISNHLTALLNDGKSDVVNLLIEYINNTTYSVHRCREIIQLVKTADTNIILDLVEGRITGNQFILHCRRNKPVKCDESYSVEEGARRLKSDCNTTVTSDIVLDTIFNATLGFTETVNFYIDMLSNAESGNKFSALEKINGIEELINSAITSLKEAII